MTMDTSSVDEILLECIERGLDVFGQNVKQAVYYRLSQDRQMAGKGGILRNPKSFEAGLEKLFGEAGVVLVKRTIMREIKSSFNLVGDIRDLSIVFSEARKKAKISEDGLIPQFTKVDSK